MVGAIPWYSRQLERLRIDRPPKQGLAIRLLDNKLSLQCLFRPACPRRTRKPNSRRRSYMITIIVPDRLRKSIKFIRSVNMLESTGGIYFPLVENFSTGG